MRAAIYTRISDARDDDTAGVRRQEQDCRVLIDQRGWAVADVYCDNNKSASVGTRPEYRRLLEDVKAGEVDAVVAWSTDRLYRRLTDLEEIVNVLGPVPVVTVKSGTVDLSTADGKTVARILGSVAQGEVEKRGERVARAARQRAEAGRFGGGTRRFGYTATMDALVPDEADAVAWAYERILSGGSIREIAREWSSRGLRGPTGADVTPGMVRGVLMRPANAGLSAYKRQIVGRSKLPTIVSEDVYRQATASLSDPRRRTSPDDGRRTLLAGVLVCGVCGGPVRAHNRGGRSRPRRRAYGCHRSRCVTRSRARLDEAVSELVVAYLVKHRSTYRRAPKAVSKAAQRASADAVEIQKRLDDLAALVAAGELSPADYAPAARGLRERLLEAESRVTRHAGTPATSKLLEADDVISSWAASAVSVQRSVIREVVESITIPVGTPGRFSMSGVTVAWRLK